MTSSVRTTDDALAWLMEREHLRTLRLQRHLVVATAAGVLLAVLASAVDTLLEAALLPVLVGITVGSFARGVDARFGHLWGWLYSEPLAFNKLDRLAAKLIESARPPVRDRPGRVEVRVRPIDPFD